MAGGPTGGFTRSELVETGVFVAAGLAEVLARDWNRPLWLLTGLPAVFGLFLLLARRRHPLTALSVFVAGAILTTWVQTFLPDPTARSTGAGVPILALILLCYSLGAYGDRTALLLGAPQPVVLVAAVDLLQPTAGALGAGVVFFLVFVVGAPMAAGRLVRSRRTLSAELQQLEGEAAAAHAAQVRAGQAEQALVLSAQLQGTLVDGLRTLARLEEPAALEARARDLLAATRDTVVRLNTPADAPAPGEPDPPVPAGVGATTETATGWVVIIAAAVGCGLLAQARPAWSHPAPVLLLTAGIVAALLLAVRRALAGVLLAWLLAGAFHLWVAPLSNTLTGTGLTVAGAFLVCWLERRRSAVLGVVVVLVAALLLPTGDVVGALALTLMATAAGRLVRAQGQLARRVEQAHRLASARRSAELAGRLAEDRAALARDLHDSVGHRLTVISLQAAAARRLAESDPAASVGALATLRSTIDLALEELGSGLPGARLTDLVREARAIGLTVDLVGAVPTGPLASVLERVVQEALTNAMRHAPGAAVHIELREDAGRLRCTVRNGPATAIGGAYPSAGQGLRGIAHRVGTAGGTLDWRPTHDGGFRVDVVLPTIQETVP